MDDQVCQRQIAVATVACDLSTVRVWFRARIAEVQRSHPRRALRPQIWTTSYVDHTTLLEFLKKGRRVLRDAAEGPSGQIARRGLRLNGAAYLRQQSLIRQRQSEKFRLRPPSLESNGGSKPRSRNWTD
jgi:hypothetical protein